MQFFISVVDVWSYYNWQGVLDGKYDDLPEQSFYMVGGIEEVIAKAEKIAKESAAWSKFMSCNNNVWDAAVWCLHPRKDSFLKSAVYLFMICDFSDRSACML